MLRIRVVFLADAASAGIRLVYTSLCSRERSTSFLPERAEPMRVSSDLRVATVVVEDVFLAIMD